MWATDINKGCKVRLKAGLVLRGKTSEQVGIGVINNIDIRNSTVFVDFPLGRERVSISSLVLVQPSEISSNV